MLAHPSRFAIIPEDVKMRVDAYGKGLLTLWAPQQLVLNHPARPCADCITFTEEYDP